MVFPLQAQISVEAISTDTVDIFSKPQVTSAKSSPLSLISTMILPGSAHQGIGRPKSALAYISLDVAALFSAIFFNRFAQRTTDDAKAYAALYAGAPADFDDVYYWKLVGAFDTYSDFQEALKLNRDTDRKFNGEKYLWKWDHESSREEFSTMQKTAKKYGMISSFCIGAMVLNRVIAFIDMRSSLKNNRYNDNASVSVVPYISDCPANGLAVRSDF
jgi:hypothetical protein